MTKDVTYAHEDGLYEIRRFKNGTYRLLLSEQGHRLLRYHAADDIASQPEVRRDFAAVVSMLDMTLQYAALEKADNERQSEYDLHDEIPF